MISPESLRKYQFFGFLQEDEFSKVAVFAEEVVWEEGDVIFTINEQADKLFLLESGDVDLHYKVVDEIVSDKSKEFFIGSINPGEPIGLSALLEPYTYTASAVAVESSKGIAVDAKKLRALAEEDSKLGFALMTQLAKSAFDRLGQVRVELAAARE
jgi:CRP-like cAMP-binding protein